MRTSVIVIAGVLLADGGFHQLADRVPVANKGDVRQQLSDCSDSLLACEDEREALWAKVDAFQAALDACQAEIDASEAALATCQADLAECQGATPACALPATGQRTECSEYVEGKGCVSFPCEGAEGTGQDGWYEAGCPMAGRFVDNQDGTVTDTCTGLMWQKDTADINGDGKITPANDAGDSDVLSWQDSINYCESLSFAGHDDWRLPNKRELHSIVDYGRASPSIDPVFGAIPDAYWSSTSYKEIPCHKWYVVFSGGVQTWDGKDCYYYVRAVRNAP